MAFERRILVLLALVLGLIAGILMLLDAAGRSVNVLGLLAGLAVLYGSYLIYRGKGGHLFGTTKTRFGAFLNLGIGIITLIVPGGVGGTASVLAIVSGILGLLAA